MITKRAAKTADEISRQLERIFTLHYTYNLGTKKMMDIVDKIGYQFISRLAY